ncbi:odorant receptor 85a-like [Cydia fagiglandana]|uniref:odorant receptor 85a-like n=1 Tax=Cydia fagiglandana TaxID=1458189 RepID=UPI002FEE2B07
MAPKLSDSAKSTPSFKQSDRFKQPNNSKQSDGFKQSDSFKQNRFCWSVFGLWPGKIPEKYYKFFSFAYLMISYVVYNALLTLNLYHTPRRIETLIREIIFTFTEIAVGSKLSMILFKRNKIAAIFEMIDREEFKGNDDIAREIVVKHNDYYKKYLLLNTVLSNFTYFSQVLFPVFGFWFFGNTLDLPICKYYFLSDETRDYYFTSIFLYQSFFMYGHMMYNVNIDTLIAGFMVLAIGQVKVLCHDLENLKTDKSVGGQSIIDLQQQYKLRKILNHYELLSEYCDRFQDVIGRTMFVQYGIGSGIICVIMCGLLLPSSLETQMFMVGYFMAMNLQIFVPAWLGTQLTYESEALTTAAYKSEWLPRSERYKSSIKLMMERAKNPVIITGLKIFPLSLATYIQIMKTAYSCFALLRIIQDRQEQTGA